MGNPNTPAPLEDVALLYVIEAMKSLGAYNDAHPAAAVYAQTYMRGLVRGVIHFLDDHFQITWDDYTVDPTLPIQEIEPDESITPRRVMPKEVINVVGAWKNQSDI